MLQRLTDGFVIKRGDQLRFYWQVLRKINYSDFIDDGLPDSENM